MNYLIIGDVHGCYYTLKRLIDEHFNGEQLIFLGDYIDRGKNVVKTLEYLFELVKKHPSTILLRGNHEQEMIEYYENYKNDHWFTGAATTTIKDLKEANYSIEKVLETFKKFPLFFENDVLFASHAGVSSYEHVKENPNDPCGLLWNRMTLDKLDKIQVHGHTPALTGPLYNEYSNSWNIDTGACFNGALSALRLNQYGQVIKIIKIKTDPKDIIS